MYGESIKLNNYKNAAFTKNVRAAFVLCSKINDKYKLDNQNERHTKFKIPVLGLMTKHMHSKCGSETAANNRQ